ncbi:MAG TPA: hypothetical protein VIA62_02945 [Thermoanaerobaculia bacterium]|jgi:hypothetical protein|nr:hypothetical protein [Thermoanaerobaculia bacterium]
MRKQARLTPLRKLFILLALLTATLGSLSTYTVTKAHALICCSACDVNPNSAPCRHGCSPSC